MKKDIDSKELVVKANQLIEAHYKLTSQEQKLVLAVVSMIQRQDEDFKEYLIPVEDFKRLMGVEGNNYSTRLKQKARALLKKPLTIPLAKGGWLVANWFSSIEENNNEACVRISFDPKLKPYLLRLKERFTPYRLHNAVRLSGAHSIRIYELLKQYENTNIKCREFELDDLRRILGCEDKLKTYDNFKRVVLEPAQKELAKKTDISFTYKVRKIGRRVNWIIFNIKSRKKVFINDGKGDEINMADVASIAATPKTPPSPTPAYSVADIPTEILRWIPETHQSHRGVLRDIIIYTETHGLPYVVQKVAYTTTRKPKDFAAYLGNALKKDLGADFDPRQPPPSPKPSLPKINPGMRVLYGGSEYVVDEYGCIRPESGGVIPFGRVRVLIGTGAVRII